MMLREALRLRKAPAYAFVAGLLVGPFLTALFGIQVTARSARAELIDFQASMCDARARTEVREPNRLDRNARQDLAVRFAAMPGQRQSTDYAVVSLCVDKLSG